MKTNKKQYLSDLSLLFVAAVWGGGFVAVKSALATMTPLVLMAYRFSLASLIMYIFLHKKIGKLSLKDIKEACVPGIILFIGFATQTFGLKYTTASKQGFLTATYVVMVPLLYWMLYKKKPQTKVIVGSFITIIGIGLVSYNKDLSFNIGDGLTLVCALFFAGHILSLEHYTKKIEVMKLSFIQLFVAALLFIAAALIFEPININLSRPEVGAIVYLAIFSTFLCFTVQTIAQKYTTSSHAAIIMSLESVFSAIFGILLLSETMTPLMVAGSVMIFVAILLIEVNLKKKKME